MDLAADPVARARLLRRAHDVMLSGCGTPPVLRDAIVRSWERCLAARVDPGRPAPILLGADEAAARFERHPLAAVLPLVRQLLDAVSAQARHVVAIADADGTLLWLDGHPRMLEAAQAARFKPGALYSETGAGTNAVGTALALGHPMQVFSAEHFCRLLHGWTSAAAPVRDPATGATLGAIAVCASFRNAHPHTLALVTATARSAEVELERARAAREAELLTRYIDRLPAGGPRPSALVAADGRVLAAWPCDWLGPRVTLPVRPGGRAALAGGRMAVLEPIGDGACIVWRVRAHERRVPRRRLQIRALGDEPPEVRLGRAPLALSGRQTELLVVLAMTPAGASARSLADDLYGAGGKTVTVRAEVARLRRMVGDLVGAQPYRLNAAVRADFLEVERLLALGRVEAAVRRYRGPLMPRSCAPAIVARRAALEAALAQAVGATGDRALRRRWERRRLRARDCPPRVRAVRVG